ncbi:hypothetical protein F0L68_40370 [Solihabitans fulvus]|uniref:IrrE N-terminal-like domain-containing protein n=1 Tax=Solihabitans fulvus TaxID=1892852 RepID=A0A5B2W7E4_9PSEU|nr:hypothetical protein [Solihabitans fulvus]KAA2247175.1 hypothetical protein F0L68_40370 [Solihabitans fulvus]
MSAATHRYTTQCHDLVAALAVPDPFRLDEFLALLVARRGRRIELRPTHLGPTATCGLPTSGEDVDILEHPIATTVEHARRLVLHQVGHLLLGHPCRSVGQAAADADERAAVARLLPGLSPALIRRLLGSSPYAPAQEHAAYLFAEAVLTNAGARRQCG